MGPSGPTQTSSTVTQSNLPEWLKGPVMDVVGRAQNVADQPYTPYPYQRTAGFTPAEQQVQQNILGMQSPNQFAFGSGLAAAAGQGTLASANYDPAQFNAQQISGPALQYFQMGGPDTFGSEQAQQYMSPYIQNVLDIQKREALRDAQQGQLAQDLGAARQGTYGGSRQLIAALGRERNLGQQMGDIQATGMQSAFQNAQQQFNTEQGLRQQAGMQNLNAALDVQGLGSQNYMQSAMANQQYDFEAQRAAEASRQFGARQGLEAYGQAGQLAQTLGNLGSAQQQADLARLQAQGQVASMPRTMEQSQLDMQYQDFLRQRDYPMEQLGFLSSIIRGLPYTPNSTQNTYGPGISPLSYLTSGLGSLAARSIAG